MWSLTWPWKKKTSMASDLVYNTITLEKFKRVFGHTINNNKRVRTLQGLEPNSEQWETLIDIASFFMGLLNPNDTQSSKIHELFNIILEAESEMDFDTSAIAVSVIGYYLFPMYKEESEQEYYLRVLDRVMEWRRTRGVS